MIGRRFPRRLIFDSMGEFADIPAAVSVWTLADTLRELKRAAHRQRWVLVTRLSPSDTIKVITAIAPPDSDPHASFSCKVGGVCVEHSEVSLIAPPHMGIDPAVMGMISYGRHYRVSALLATRRPAETNRIITSQADIVAAFTQHEPNDIDYLERAAASGIGEKIAQLKEFEHVRLVTASRDLYIVDRNGGIRKG